MNKGCRVDHCSNMPKFEVGLGALLVCRNHLGKAVEEYVDDENRVMVALHQISDLEYLRTENKRLRQRVRELEDFN